ncbi:hypothetical protein VISI1226_05703 [Vibrio sinaloensis DSM 21326]|uniref:DUF2218 domain-containing protein n=1 Tax=Vibrio sinaloensis DSM 21326 TaxID=945550 RepID=E8M125_PHOS4|nr:DUF2218 domain-containing protein [Vibrio sinaloensis]EGA72264.1 hypothetical protein VISI1226_05703 [Vibrio sinaloensis DSM 21326]
MVKFTTIQSEHASKYLTVLCRHFARKVDSTWDDDRGHVTFPMGEASMLVDHEKQQLTISCSASDEDKLKGVIGIIESHVHLFARREPIALVWQ